MQDVASLRIRHHGDVLVPTPERGLVHRKAPDRCRLAARKSPYHRTLHDAIHRVPAQPHPPGDRLDAGFLQPRDHLRLEQGRVPRTPLRPRHLDRHHSVLRALDPRDVADQKGLVAPGVQIPPLAAARIVTRARLAAVRTPQRACPGPVQLHPKLLRFPCWLHSGDLPLRTEAQNGIQPVLPGHVCEFLSVSLWHTVPRANAPQRDHAISSESPGPERQSAALLPVQQQYRWLGCPTGLLCVERSRGSLVASAARQLPPHLTPLTSPSSRLACKSLPARPMIQLPALTTHHDR